MIHAFSIIGSHQRERVPRRASASHDQDQNEDFFAFASAVRYVSSIKYRMGSTMYIYPLGFHPFHMLLLLTRSRTRTKEGRYHS